MNIIISLLIGGLAVFISAYIIPGANVDSFLTAIIVAVLLSIVNATIGFLLKVITFPLNIITLGIMSVFINVLMVLLVAKIVSGFNIDGIFIALIFAIILSIINMFFAKSILNK